MDIAQVIRLVKEDRKPQRKYVPSNKANEVMQKLDDAKVKYDCTVRNGIYIFNVSPSIWA